MSKTNAATGRPRLALRGAVGGAGGLGTLVPGLLALVGGFLATLLFSRTPGSFLSGLIGGFAVFGAFWAVSMVWRAFRGEPEAAPPDVLGPAVLAAAKDGLVVVEDGERVAVANPAYLAMSRSEAANAPTPEQFLARAPGSQAALAEILNAVADGRSFERTFQTEGAGGLRQVEVAVHPLETPRRVLWSVRVLPLPVVAPTPPNVAPVAAPVVAEPPAMAGLDLKTAATLLETWERAPAGVARFAAERVVLANVTLCRMLGYSLADWPQEGMALAEVVAPEHLAPLRAAVGAGRGPSSLELDLIRQDGRAVPAVLSLGASDGAGEATAIVLPRGALPVLGAAPSMPVAIPLEVTPPVAAASGEMDQFFRRAPLALALVDAQGHIRAANAAFGRLFGSEIDQAIGKPLAALIAERDAGAVAAFLAEAGAGTAPAHLSDVSAAGASGRSARLYGAPVAAAGGAIALCAIDTTEQKALEVQFAQSQRLQAVGHLAGGVAHDFNNVLTAIIGYCDLLLAKHRPSDPSFPDIMQIKQNANRAAALVRQLLAFSRRQTLRPQEIELTDVISDVSELLRRLIGERITLEVQHARDLWPVKVDVNQFEQVIVNLVVNARDAMPDGGTLTLRTLNVPTAACATYGEGALTPADYVLVEVEDTGSGIPPDIIDKIFEPFFSTKEVGKGTGLGLSTVYGIVQQTGGTILAASEPGKGSVFRVFLPRYVPGAEGEPPRPVEPEVKVGDSTGQGRILLVEDEDAVRAFASRALSARGYEVSTAASGVEAMELINQGGPKIDLVISDVVMPEMDGPSLLRELRARDPSMKVIFISGYAEEAFARNLPPSEHFAFLPKPFSLKQLVAAVNTTLRGGE